MPALAAKYEDFWPVELYAKISLCKGIASDRHRFRVATEKYKLLKGLAATSTVNTPSPKVCRWNAFSSVARTHHYLHQHDSETPPLDPPLPHDAPDSAACGENDFSVQVHPDAVPEEVEEFLRSCDLDLGHLTDAFVTSRAGLFNMERLKLISLWPAALRRDHFERHFSTVLDDVEVEVLTMRLREMSRDC